MCLYVRCSRVYSQRNVSLYLRLISLLPFVSTQHVGANKKEKEQIYTPNCGPFFKCVTGKLNFKRILYTLANVTCCRELFLLVYVLELLSAAIPWLLVCFPLFFALFNFLSFCRLFFGVASRRSTPCPSSFRIKK